MALNNDVLKDQNAVYGAPAQGQSVKFAYGDLSKLAAAGAITDGTIAFIGNENGGAVYANGSLCSSKVLSINVDTAGNLQTTTIRYIDNNNAVAEAVINSVNADYVAAELATVAAAKSFSIAALSAEELAGLADANVKEAFKLVDGDGTQAGSTIKIYKDSALKSVELVAEKPAEEEGGEAVAGQFLKFVYILASGEESDVYLDVSQFLVQTEFKNGLTVNAAGEVSVALAEDLKDAEGNVTSKNFVKFEGDVDGAKTIALREIDTNKTVLQQPITVAGLSGAFGAGNYSNDDVIPAGTDVYTILQNILCKELYPSVTRTTGVLTPALPAPAISLDKASTVEVGTLVTMTSATVGDVYASTHSVQSFTGMEYGYSAANDDSKDSTDKSISTADWTYEATSGEGYTLSATLSGFNADTVTNKQNTPASVNAQAMATNVVLGCCAEGDNKITVSATGPSLTGSIDGIDAVYYCSNLGNTDAAKVTTAIPAITNHKTGTTSNSNSKTVKAQFKYFFGYSDKTLVSQFDSASVRALTTKTNWITKDGTTTISSGVVESNGKSIVVACPAKYKLASVEDSMGNDYMGLFSEVGDVSVATGSINTTYKVFMYPITSGTVMKLKNITLTKA